MIHLAIIESDPIWRHSLQELFEQVPTFSVDYCTDDYLNGAEILSNKFTGIVVIGLSNNLGVQDGKRAVRILTTNSHCRVLVVSKENSINLVTELLNFGISGFAVKELPLSQFVSAVEDIDAGGAYLSPSVAAKLVSLFKKEFNSDLSQREIEVLGHMAKGKSYTTIADELFISRTTVKAHMRNIYSKLEVNNKASAIKKAYSQRILISVA